MIHIRRRSQGGDTDRDNLVTALDQALAVIQGSHTRNPDAETFNLHIPDVLASIGVVSFTYQPDAFPDEGEYVARCADGVGEVMRIQKCIDHAGFFHAVLKDIVRAISRAQSQRAFVPIPGRSCSYCKQTIPQPEKEVDA